MKATDSFPRGARRSSRSARLGGKVSRATDTAEDVAPLTQAQLRELRRRIRDLDDRARYFLVSRFTPRFALYYNVSEDAYGMNEPSYCTLFKRRAAALAIKRRLGRNVEIARCRVTRRGKLVMSSIPARYARRRSRRRGAV